MATWNTTPSEGVSIDQATGKITFPTASTSTEYTVNYTDDNGCTAETTYTVTATTPTCSCSDLTVSSPITVGSESAKVNVGTVNTACTISLECGDDFLGYDACEWIILRVRLDDGLVWLNIAENTSAFPRLTTARFVVDGTPCTPFDVKQEGIGENKYTITVKHDIIGNTHYIKKTLVSGDASIFTSDELDSTIEFWFGQVDCGPDQSLCANQDITLSELINLKYGGIISSCSGGGDLCPIVGIGAVIQMIDLSSKLEIVTKG